MRAMRDGVGDRILRRHLHLLRVAQQIHRQTLDLRFEGGREQQRLPLAGHARQNALNRRQKAHIEHAVGFVQHQQAHAVEFDRTAIEMIDQAPGVATRMSTPRRSDCRPAAACRRRRRWW
jgi:hypothetical protein